MIAVIYASGIVYMLFVLASRVPRTRSLEEALFVLVVAAIPVGKLVYFNVPFSMGLKFCFVLLCAALALLMLRAAVSGERFRTSLLVGLVLVVPILISMLMLEEPRTFLFYRIRGAAQSESVLFRLLSLCALVGLFVWTRHRSSLAVDGYRESVREYLHGLTFATAVGFVIFFGVFADRITRADLLPISADTHLIGNIYRFNPGTNVNEFGMLVGYGLLLLLHFGRRGPATWGLAILFVLAEFLSLTRMAWVGTAVGLLVYLLRRGARGIAAIGVTALGLFILLLFAGQSRDIMALIETRTTLSVGASGDDRLEKFEFVFDSLARSPWRLLFGHGWATNLYVHSVPLQILYEIGLVGFSVFAAFALWLLYLWWTTPACPDRDLAISLLAMLFIFSLAHHTLYHMQTWFVLGLVAAIHDRAIRRTAFEPIGEST